MSRGKELGKAIRTHQHHYTRWHTGEELYDLLADPHEESNLAGPPPHEETLQNMRWYLDQAEERALARKRK